VRERLAAPNEVCSHTDIALCQGLAVRRGLPVRPVPGCDAEAVSDSGAPPPWDFNDSFLMTAATRSRPR